MSMWIPVRETDRPLSISEAAVSVIENCVTLSASLRRHVGSRSNRNKIDFMRVTDRSLFRAIRMIAFSKEIFFRTELSHSIKLKANSLEDNREILIQL